MFLIETLFPNWTNPEAVAAVVGLRVLCNGVILWVTSNIAGVRSSSTAIVGGLFGFSTITTLLLLSTSWLSHPISYIEQLSQLLVLVVSLFILIRNEFNILVASQSGLEFASGALN